MSSRQWRYQLRHRAIGQCSLCPRKLFSTYLCRKHLRDAREKKRAQRGHQRWEPGKPGRPPLERR